jgi:hypothetical protein
VHYVLEVSVGAELLSGGFADFTRRERDSRSHRSERDGRDDFHHRLRGSLSLRSGGDDLGVFGIIIVIVVMLLGLSDVVVLSLFVLHDRQTVHTVATGHVGGAALAELGRVTSQAAGEGMSDGETFSVGAVIIDIFTADFE